MHQSRQLDHSLSLSLSLHPQTDGLLDDADIALRSTQRILTNLTVRLPVLQELIATNRRDLENATNTTDRAEVVTAQANQVCAYVLALYRR